MSIRRFCFGFGLTSVAIGLLLVGFAGDASAQDCRRTCNQTFGACVEDAKIDLNDCRDACPADDVQCTIGCINTFRGVLGDCRTARSGCLGDCPPGTCVGQCAREFTMCVRAAADAFRVDCIGAICNEAFMAELEECELLEGAEAAACRGAARRARGACINECSATRRGETQICRDGRNDCVETCNGG